MKKIKIKKCLCLLFVTVCSILFMNSFTAFAAHTNGSTEVTAHIESAPNETSQPINNGGGSSAEQDTSNVSTGDEVSACVVVSSLLLITSVLVICFCKKTIRTTKI